MRNVIIICTLVASFILFFILRAYSQQIKYPTLAEVESIESIVKPFLEDKRTKGLSIGIIKDGKTEFLNYGSLSANDESEPTQENIYEIGSITKTFTASLLVQMAEEGLVKLDDPVSKYLPKGVCTWPTEKSITLQDLSSHHSGLPRLASNFFATVSDNSNPYKDYNVDHLYAYLKTFKGVAKEKRNVEYSNLGVELLGHILGLVSEQSYEEMVTERIFKPLEMHNTTITFDESHLKKLAVGHDERGNQTSNWDFPTFGGAGAIRSTTEDMLKYLEAQMSNEMYAKAHDAKLDMGGKSKIGLGWITTTTKNGEDIVWHNGGTGGYRSTGGFVKNHNLGVIVLNNSALSVDEIGFLVTGYMLKKEN